MTTPADQPDLIAWLRAQLDEREREVRERHRRTCGHEEVGPDWPCNCDDHVSFSLAEVDAKRRILDLHSPMRLGAFVDLSCPVCWRTTTRSSRREDHPSCPTLRLLALPYADRPGYRDEWRPA